ncbi:hypothetical protein GA0074695_4343 [Micromonospora viridifaciens]|uniref:ABC-2 family transporter protein n=1 Tax=Micromonospora viridifaciens TaxID=1881 RepID=A0A1C4YJ79_MICVI|nr:hypothetical protein [Micromonospora viridifaciens]SCF20793.1 hypothetical protein GA0074695_4343 [Micromonospora viridifaciens]
MSRSHTLDGQERRNAQTAARLAQLHLRARGGPVFGVGLGLAALLAWGAGHWLATRPYFSGPVARLPVVLLAPLLAAVLLAPTLAGADDELERGTALPWQRWRLGHLLLAAAAIGGLLALTGLRAPEVFGAYALSRNTLGCVGLVAVGAALLGARLAWLPAFGYVCAIYAAGPRQVGGAAGVWAWPAQPSSVTSSWLTACTLFAFGTLWYAVRGAQRGPGQRSLL